MPSLLLEIWGNFCFRIPMIFVRFASPSFSPIFKSPWEGSSIYLKFVHFQIFLSVFFIPLRRGNIYTSSSRRRRRNPGEAMRTRYTYISEISALSAPRIYRILVYLGTSRRTRAERHFYEEPAGYAYKYRQYILLAVDRQSFSCVKYFNRQITIPPSPVLFYSSPSQFPPIVV